MRGLLSILSLFRKGLNEFNNPEARMIDYIYNMTLRLLWNLISGVKELIICQYVSNVVMDVIPFPENLSTTSGLSILMHEVISLQDAMSWDKWRNSTHRHTLIW